MCWRVLCFVWRSLAHVAATRFDQVPSCRHLVSETSRHRPLTTSLSSGSDFVAFEIKIGFSRCWVSTLSHFPRTMFDSVFERSQTSRCRHVHGCAPSGSFVAPRGMPCTCVARGGPMRPLPLRPMVQNPRRHGGTNEAAQRQSPRD